MQPRSMVSGKGRKRVSLRGVAERRRDRGEGMTKKMKGGSGKREKEEEELV